MVQQDRRRLRSARTRIQPRSSAAGERIGSRRSCGAGGNYGWDLIPGRGLRVPRDSRKEDKKKGIKWDRGHSSSTQQTESSAPD